jgi:hypothetical protein
MGKNGFFLRKSIPADVLEKLNAAYGAALLSRELFTNDYGMLRSVAEINTAIRDQRIRTCFFY